MGDVIEIEFGEAQFWNCPECNVILLACVVAGTNQGYCNHCKGYYDFIDGPEDAG